MKFVELSKNLNNKVSHLYNLVGDDVFLIKQAVLNFKSVCVKDLEEFNYIKLDNDKLKADEFLSQLSTMPIGNDYKLVVVNNPNPEIIKAISNFDFEDSQTVLVTINAKNLKNAEEIDCSKLERADIEKYVMNYLYKSKLSIEERALDLLIDLSNSNMAKIVSELNKIVAYAHGEEIVNVDMVTNLVSKSQEYVIYMLTTAIDNKDLASFQKMFVEMSKTQSVQDIFSYLGKYFRRMQYIAINKDDETLSKILNVKPYAIKMSRQNIKKNGVKYYVGLYKRYVDLDYKIKSGKISVKNALFELLLGA